MELLVTDNEKRVHHVYKMWNAVISVAGGKVNKSQSSKISSSLH